jgi:hypothetical protein
MEMMMRRVVKAIGMTLAFFLTITGVVFILELLKAFVGVWVIIPLLIACAGSLFYFFYQDAK